MTIITKQKLDHLDICAIPLTTEINSTSNQGLYMVLNFSDSRWQNTINTSIILV